MRHYQRRILEVALPSNVVACKAVSKGVFRRNLLFGEFAVFVGNFKLCAVNQKPRTSQCCFFTLLPFAFAPTKGCLGSSFEPSPEVVGQVFNIVAPIFLGLFGRSQNALPHCYFVVGDSRYCRRSHSRKKPQRHKPANFGGLSFRLPARAFRSLPQ